VTPARLASCLRLMRGITVQLDINRTELHRALANRDLLEKELSCLARLIGEDRFADIKILSSLTQRMSRVAIELNICKQKVELSRKKDIKFNRSKDLLTERLRIHDREKQEIELMELTSARLSLRRAGQSATRMRH
jgi:hypothetical protein